MAFNPISTGFSNAAGAVGDLFKGFGALEQGQIKAKGLNIDAQGQRLNAQGLRIKAQGDLSEASNYDLARDLSRQNEQFTQASTAIKEGQIDRQTSMAIGGQQADVAGAGFASSGSAIDLLRESAQQGALTKQVAGQQGLITEAGYEEQAQSYQTMANAGRYAAAGEMDIADKTDVIANQTDQLAKQTIHASQTEAAGDFASSALKGAASIFSFFGL